MKNRFSAEEYIEHLKLQSHPKVTGFFTEAYRHTDLIKNELPAEYTESARANGRSMGTVAQFLLKSTDILPWSRSFTDKFYQLIDGTVPYEFYIVNENEKKVETIIFGFDLSAGQKLSAVIPKGAWLACRLSRPCTEDDFCLFSCFMAPGYHPEDWELKPDLQIPGIKLPEI